MQPIQMSHNCVEFMDHVVFLILFEWAAFNAKRFSPFREARTCRGQPTCQFHRPLPQGARTCRAWDRKRVEDKIVQVDLHEPSCIPVRGNEDNTPRSTLILYVTSRPYKIRPSFVINTSAGRRAVITVRVSVALVTSRKAILTSWQGNELGFFRLSALMPWNAERSSLADRRRLFCSAGMTFFGSAHA